MQKHGIIQNWETIQNGDVKYPKLFDFDILVADNKAIDLALENLADPAHPQTVAMFNEMKRIFSNWRKAMMEASGVRGTFYNPPKRDLPHFYRAIQLTIEAGFTPVQYLKKLSEELAKMPNVGSQKYRPHWTFAPATLYSNVEKLQEDKSRAMRSTGGRSFENTSKLDARIRPALEKAFPQHIGAYDDKRLLSLEAAARNIMNDVDCYLPTEDGMRNMAQYLADVVLCCA